MAVRAGAAGTVPASVAALVGTTLRRITILKTSMIAAGLLAASLVSMVGAGRVAGVTRGEAGEIAGPPGQDDRAPRISVRTVRPTTVAIKQQYAAQIHSRRHIQVRALVEGSLAPIPIKEGQAVKAGDRMFEITSPILKARLDAELAGRDRAEVELKNTMKLAEQKAASDDEVKLSRAKLAKAQTKVDLAKAELDFATIKAPFDGIVGRLNAKAGSNVKEGDELTTLSDNSVMWVYFKKVPEKSDLESMAGRREGEESPAIGLMLADRRKFPHPGKLGAIDKFKDENGPVAHRADFPNPDNILQRGQTGTVSINRVLKDAIVIPARATFEDHDKRYVYFVEDNNVARKREIAVRAEVDDEFVVEAGIKVGDRIVSDGIGKVHDGDKVKN
jgi:membrane fusion protein (multidrug efflux system)